MRKRKAFSFYLWIIVAAAYCVTYYSVKHNVFQAAALTDTPPIIIIDAGHGGEDGGAVSVTGAKESDINLSIALRLEQIMALCGIHTKMIRTEDVSVYTTGNTITEKKVSDLKHRVQIVNDTVNAILLSVHQNHFSESKYSGAQVFHAATASSKAMAERMQQGLRQYLDSNNQRQVKPASSVYLMEKISCPGVLIECGFLSNPAEEIQLQNTLYQTKMSCVITASMIQFLEEGTYFEV